MPILPAIGFHQIRLSDQVWFWLNLSNLRTSFFPLVVPALSHFWTLAIEEQFYLIWPFVIRTLSRRAAILLCSMGLISGPVLRHLPIVLSINAHYADFIYRFTLLHVDGMFAGSLLALVLPLVSFRTAQRALAGCFLLGAATLALMNYRPELQAGWMFSGTALFFTGIVGLLVLDSDNLFGRLLKRAPVVRLGQRSYAFYVVHPPIVLIVLQMIYRAVPALWGHAPVYRIVVICAASLLVCWGVAEISWKLIESPFLSLKSRFQF